MEAACTSKDYITSKLKKKKKENKSRNYVLFNVTTPLLITLLHIDTMTHGAPGIVLNIDNGFSVKDSLIFSISLKYI